MYYLAWALTILYGRINVVFVVLSRTIDAVIWSLYAWSYLNKSRQHRLTSEFYLYWFLWALTDGYVSESQEQMSEDLNTVRNPYAGHSLEFDRK